MRFRHISLLVALAVWLLSWVALITMFVGKKWMDFGGGTETALLAAHFGLHWLALGLGGASAIGWIHRWVKGRPAAQSRA